MESEIKTTKVINKIVSIYYDKPHEDTKKQVQESIKSLYGKLGQIVIIDTSQKDYLSKIIESITNDVTNSKYQEENLVIVLSKDYLSIVMNLNKNKFVRAVNCYFSIEAKLTREHNASNVICLSSDVLGVENIKDLVANFISADVSTDERHIRRVNKIEI